MDVPGLAMDGRSRPGEAACFTRTDSAEHQRSAGAVRALMAKHDEVELLVRLGEYKRGSDALADKAIDRIADIRAFLRQSAAEHVGADDLHTRLQAVAA